MKYIKTVNDEVEYANWRNGRIIDALEGFREDTEETPDHYCIPMCADCWDRQQARIEAQLGGGVA